jgi:hypothetical protein
MAKASMTPNTAADALSPARLERRAEEEEKEHVPEEVPEITVQEHVGERSPRAEDELTRLEGEPVEHEALAHDQPHGVDERVGDQQPLHHRRGRQPDTEGVEAGPGLIAHRSVIVLVRVRRPG